MPKKATIQDVINFLEENANNQCSLLSTSYKNSTTPLRLLCNRCGKEFERDFSHIKRGRFLCQECCQEVRSAPANKCSLEDVKEYLEKNDVKHECTLLSTEYKSNKDPLKFQCNVCGKIFYRDFIHVKRNRFRCATCGEKAGASKLVYTKEDVEKDIIRDGYTLIGEYVNAGTGVLCQCTKQHKPFYLFYSDYKFCGRGCPECGHLKLSGENHWNWQGGISYIADLFREAANPWKYSIFNKSPICDITGLKDNLEVHHLNINFSTILKEAIKNTNFVYKGDQLKDYSQEEIETLRKEILKLHLEKVQGVVLNKQVHQLFHSLYGKENNTPEQYFDFKEKIQKGEIELNGVICKQCSNRCS